jgi:ABC-type sulfate transport system substrate-binding protein
MAIKVIKKMFHDSQVFVVRNPKKIEFWKDLASRTSEMQIIELEDKEK